MKFKAYPKIKQFRDIVRAVQTRSDFKGQDEDGNPIYEKSERPTLKFKGTTKLHGTSAGICYTPTKGLVAQKRSSFLPVESLDGVHFGFNEFVQGRRKTQLLSWMEKLHNKYCTPYQQITVYGEWAGQGVQKSVAISELQKTFYVFDVRVYDEVLDQSEWITLEEEDKPEILGVCYVDDFECWEMEIDFNQPQNSQNQLVDLTLKVEEQCPISKYFGIDGIGEGIVWTAYWKGERYCFKVKGEKHSTSKVKKLASVDPEVLKNIQEFVDYACTQNRMDQAIMETEADSKRNTPDVLRWMANDIIKEESDVLESNNLTWKQVAKEVSDKTRRYFFEKLDKL